MRLSLSPLLSLLVAAPALAAGPALVWSQQGQADSAATFYSRAPGGPSRAVATVPTVPEYEPWSALAPDGSAIAAVSLVKSVDRTRGATVFRIALPGGKVTALASGCSYQKPLALSGGRVAFVKITAVESPPPERSQQGELDTLGSELWLADADGALRRLAGDAGYALFPVAATSDAVFAYRVAKDEGALYRVPLAGGEWRRVAPLPGPGFARDFSVRGDELVFASVTPDAKWALFSVGLSTGAVRELTALPTDHATPLAAGKAVVFLEPAKGGERLVAWQASGTRTVVEGTGLNVAQAATRDGRTLAIQRQLPDAQQLWVFWGGRTPERVETARFFTVTGFAEGAR